MTNINTETVHIGLQSTIDNTVRSVIFIAIFH